MGGCGGVERTDSTELFCNSFHLWGGHGGVDRLCLTASSSRGGGGWC